MKLKIKTKKKAAKVDEPKKYRFKAANEIDEGEYVSNPAGTYCVTATGSRKTSEKGTEIEIRGYYDEGSAIMNHYVPEYQPFRVDPEAVRKVMDKFRSSAAKYWEWEKKISSKRSSSNGNGSSNGSVALKEKPKSGIRILLKKKISTNGNGSKPAIKIKLRR